MDERKAQEIIRRSVRDSLAWLDDLPSRENEILEKTEKEDKPLTIMCNGAESTAAASMYDPACRRPRSRWQRPVLAFCAVLVLVTGIWAVSRNGGLPDLASQPDVVSAPEDTVPLPEDTDWQSLPAAVYAQEAQEATPLDRIDITADPDALWNEEDGILAEGPEIDKTKVPFSDATYWKAADKGISTEGELVYTDESGTELFRDRISLQLGGDLIEWDMPQKSLAVTALDGAFEHPLFDDRAAVSYPSFLLRNSGNDCVFTRVADGVQSRLIERHTDAHVLTMAWRPVRVYLNGEYWGICNMRESVDAHTICRYEQIPDDMAADITLAYISGSAIQGDAAEYRALREKLKYMDVKENPEDLEYLEEQVDIESFLDWLAVEIYFGNSDMGNGMIYRVPGGKWKCLVQDLDYGLFVSTYESVNNYLKEDGMGPQQINNIVFRKILTVDRYRDVFLTKMGNLYKTLTAEVMQGELDRCVSWIEPGMKEHLERWAPFNDGTLVSEAPSDPEEAWNYWKGRIDRMKNTMEKRPYNVYIQIRDFFWLTEAEMIHYFMTE